EWATVRSGRPPPQPREAVAASLSARRPPSRGLVRIARAPPGWATLSAGGPRRIVCPRPDGTPSVAWFGPPRWPDRVEPPICRDCAVNGVTLPANTAPEAWEHPRGGGASPPSM